MLTHLSITNFALIEQLDLDFGSGLNVFTGETGAGKSIILDALDAVLGGKVSHSTIRTGADRALIEATFMVPETLQSWLRQEEIEPLEEQVILSRELSIKKTSRSRINGVLVNQPTIQKLRHRLVEITAQGQSLDLEKSEVQQELLDSYGGMPLAQQKNKVAEPFIAWQKARLDLEYHRKNHQEQLQKLDLYRFQKQELDEAQLTFREEEEELLSEGNVLSHAVELQTMGQDLSQLLYKGSQRTPAVIDQLAKAQDLVRKMVGFDETVQPLYELMETASTQLEECIHQLSHYNSGLEADPDRLEKIEERLQLFKKLARKYGPNFTDVYDYYQQVQKSLETLESDDVSLEALEEKVNILHHTCLKEAQKLTQLRQTTIQKLEAKLIQELAPLGMAKVRFQIKLEPSKLTAAGCDKTTFLFSPNPGEPVQPLTEIASGGEMARFLLALKACLGGADQTGTLVFDEIDIGVSGKVAQAVAEKLCQLGYSHQVLCVTHQPLVAAMADQHFRVSKRVQSLNKQERTSVQVQALVSSKERIEELAQLASGRSAKEAIDFASVLLAEAEKTRTALKWVKDER
jgi:DNA repair protein RecN (Recombination protein N)